jgi:hypothetical protein
MGVDSAASDQLEWDVQDDVLGCDFITGDHLGGHDDGRAFAFR